MSGVAPWLGAQPRSGRLAGLSVGHPGSFCSRADHMRIGLIGDTHGYLPALEAALRGCRAATCDLIVHRGDCLSSPFSPDPPAETLALLRSAEVLVVVGNGEVPKE
jgi:hypothetical protein